YIIKGDRWFITQGSLPLRHNQSRFLWFWRFKVRDDITRQDRTDNRKRGFLLAWGFIPWRYFGLTASKT
ncbi:MAG: hypothetical protein B6247_10695, partial [Candidatus Parabeggiatoa sp. nov. 2]